MQMARKNRIIFAFSQKQFIMSKRNRFLIRFFAILIVLVSVFLELDILKLSFLDPYKYWMTVLGFGMLLVVSR